MASDDDNTTEPPGQNETGPFAVIVGTGQATTVKACVATGAALKLASPSWLAVKVTVPGALMVTVFPDTEATDGTDEPMLTGSPDVLEATRSNAGSPSKRSAMTLKVIDWLAGVMVNEAAWYVIA